MSENSEFENSQKSDGSSDPADYSKDNQLEVLPNSTILQEPRWGENVMSHIKNEDTNPASDIVGSSKNNVELYNCNEHTFETSEWTFENIDFEALREFVKGPVPADYSKANQLEVLPNSIILQEPRSNENSIPHIENEHTNPASDIAGSSKNNVELYNCSEYTFETNGGMFVLVDFEDVQKSDGSPDLADYSKANQLEVLPNSTILQEPRSSENYIPHIENEHTNPASDVAGSSKNSVELYNCSEQTFETSEGMFVLVDFEGVKKSDGSPDLADYLKVNKLEVLPNSTILQEPRSSGNFIPHIENEDTNPASDMAGSSSNNAECYKCSECTFETMDECKLNDHMLKHSKIQKKSYKCPNNQCPFVSVYKRNLNRHMINCHKNLLRQLA